MEIGDRKIKIGMSWILINVIFTEKEITLIWREEVRYFMESNYVFIPHFGHRRLIEMIELGKYPRTVEDIIEIFKRSEVRRR